jgi:hypothetical protein
MQQVSYKHISFGLSCVSCSLCSLALGDIPFLLAPGIFVYLLILLWNFPFLGARNPCDTVEPSYAPSYQPSLIYSNLCEADSWAYGALRHVVWTCSEHVRTFPK